MCSPSVHRNSFLATPCGIRASVANSPARVRALDKTRTTTTELTPSPVSRHLCLLFSGRKVPSVDVVYGALPCALANGELILSRGVTRNDRALDHIAIQEACLSRQVMVVLPIQRQGGGNDMARS